MDIEILSDDEESLSQALKKKAFIVDVRTAIEYRLDRMENSVNIPLDEIPERVEEFPTKSDIIVFCRSGVRSEQAKNYLLQNGLGNVLNGGNRSLIERLLVSL